jgi:hypothetical protein
VTVAVVALVAALPLFCPCPPPRAASTGGAHDCCAPPTGVRAADAGCCGDASTTLPGALTAPAPVPAPNPDFVRFASAEGAGRTRFVPPHAAFAVAPSPPKILRI